MLGNIIGAIGSIIGGNQAAKAQKQANRQNLKWAQDQARNSVQWRVADAKKAGIHPLAALGANISATPGGVVPVTGFGDGIAAGAAALGSAVDQASQQDLTNLQTELLRAQVDQIRSQTSLNVARSRSAIAAARSSALQEGMPLTTKIKPTNTGLLIDGKKMPNAGWSDAEEVEAAYGDIVQNLYGTFKLGADAWQGWKESGAKARAEARARAFNQSNRNRSIEDY